MKWRYEPETKTIRSVPENYWVASMDSFDGAVNHDANAQLIAAAPELLDALVLALPYIEVVESEDEGYKPGAVAKLTKQIRAAITKAGGIEVLKG